MLPRSMYFVVGSVALMLSACGHVGQFVIENKTDKDAVIELTFDTNWISISNSIVDYRIMNYQTALSGQVTDSVILSYRQPTAIFSYLADSMTMKQLFDALYIPGISIYQIPKSSPRESIDFYQKVRSYYDSDSIAISKLIKDNSITLFMPSNYVYTSGCESGCGDCSCDAEDALIFNEIRINCDTGAPIVINRANLNSKASKKTYNSNSESLVLELK